MKISEIFHLNKTQYELDFIDIDVDLDKPLFLDPYFLSIREDPWSINASYTIKSFFQYFVKLIKEKNIEKAKNIFVHLGEPNETCLGVSRDKPQGKGVGKDNADKIFYSILKSKAIETGIVEDLEDSALFVDNVGRDKVSDMTTNIIKMHLIKYTQQQCDLWGIPLTSGVPSGYYWDAKNKVWNNEYTRMLIVNQKVIILVPKSVASYYTSYIDQKYHQHYVLEYLQNDHLSRNTSLVRQRFYKDGSREDYVTKIDVKNHEAPLTKEFLRDFTEKNPDIFKKFREENKKTQSSLTNEQLGTPSIEEVIDYLILTLKNLPSGPDNATEYHRLIVGIIELICYPNITTPVIEKETNDGLKRIDIVFDNAAQKGFFFELSSRHNISAPYILVECKNYSSDIANPELDQMIGRFSPAKGQVGFIISRKLNNYQTFLSRTKYTFLEKKGLIIPLTDIELINMLEKKKYGELHPEDEIFANIMRKIVFN